MRFHNKKISFVILFSAAVSTYFFFLPPAYCENENKVWKIAIFRTQPPYAVEMEAGLKNGLRRLGYAEDENMVYLPTKIVGGEVEDFSETAMRLQSILGKKPDIVATIGTQASVPARSILENAGIPMVFSGVTYPIEGDLIKAFGKPTGKNRTGISYAIPARQRLGLIRKLFPDANKFEHIAFVYSSQVLQDAAYADKLKSMENPFGWKFIYIDIFDYAQNDLSFKKLIKALKQRNPDIIFGWYTFDHFTADENNAAKLSDVYRKPILAITDKFLDKGAMAGIFSDHSGLSFQQAKMIDRIIKGENAGDIPPIEPTDYLLGINLRKARELGITFDPALIDSAHKVIR